MDRKLFIPTVGNRGSGEGGGGRGGKGGNYPFSHPSGGNF